MPAQTSRLSARAAPVQEPPNPTRKSSGRLLEWVFYETGQQNVITVAQYSTCGVRARPETSLNDPERPGVFDNGLDPCSAILGRLTPPAPVSTAP